MVSSSAVPWYNRPPRPFPAKRWLEQRYPFRVSPSVFVWQNPAAPAPGVPRRFPAQVWLEARQRRA